jgi:hypothetical protein
MEMGLSNDTGSWLVYDEYAWDVMNDDEEELKTYK